MNTTPPIALDQGWKKIKTLAIDKLQEILDTGIEKVQTNTSRLFTPGEYSNCYTTLYNMCTQKHPHNFSAQMYERHGLTISSYLERSVRPALDGISGPDLLEEMTKRWKNHQIMNKWMENFFMYLDRYYVSYHYKDALKKAGMMKFKEIIFDHVKSRLTKSITDMIEQEREGIIINRQVIMNCVSLYEAMGMNSLDAYTLDFEQPLLEQTSLYYKQRTTDWLATDSTPIYLEKIENALNNEKLRVESYLNQETESKLLRVIETVGLEYHLDEIIDKEGSGCIVLLANDKVEDLARMYRMFLRLEDKLGPMADRFQKHVESLGFALIEKRMSRFNDTNTSNESKSNDKHVASSSGDGDNKKSKSSASVEKESNNDPEFVKDLISLHEKYNSMVTSNFNNDSLFSQALSNAFTKVVNDDRGKFSNADLLSTFCDRILKKGGEKLNDNEIDELLDKIVRIFGYLASKDIFGEIYRNQLAKRKLNDRSASDEIERNMIGKLKVAVGAQFTSKMEGMMKDLLLSEDHKKTFQTFFVVEQKKPEYSLVDKVEFDVQILTQGFWPTYKNFEPALPETFKICKDLFTTHYSSRADTSRKRLTWQWTLGTAVIKANIGRKKYDLQVATLQAVVLDAFNSFTSPVSIPEIKNKLSMDEEPVKRILHSLSCQKFKVITRISDNGKTDDKGPIKPTDTFVVNTNFSSPMNRIRIPMVSLEESHNPKRVEEDRNAVIEACIVRIMKSRKTLNHQQLISEVLQQLHYFKPKIATLKKHIESLIDRDYLKRDDDDSTMYKYLA